MMRHLPVLTAQNVHTAVNRSDNESMNMIVSGSCALVTLMEKL